MDLAAAAEACRLLRAAVTSTQHPRNADLMRRPRLLASFHCLGSRLLGLLSLYGKEALSWQRLLAVVGGLEAGRVR
jgi:hypothetical protein